MATLQCVTGVAGACSPATATFSPRTCCRASTSSAGSAAPLAGSPLIRPLVSTAGSSGENYLASPSPSFSSRPTPRHFCCEALPEPGAGTPAAKTKSIVCTNCDGNGAVVCSQCEGEGLNAVDHFNGRFKAGTICWLCRGKKQILCGECNGAGFLGGFMNAQED